jgi:hypothetical protein
MSTLADFQSEASLALNNAGLMSPQAVSEQDVDGSSRRFNIYRNNRAGSLIEALQSTYPVLHKLLGDTFFRAAARQFIDKSPPTSPILNEYGEAFGQFVQKLPGTADYPYLEDVATLEWRRLRAYHALDQRVLTMDCLRSKSTPLLIASKLHRHSATWLVNSNWPVGSLWDSISTESKARVKLTQNESVLITRPELDVQMQLLDTGSALFLEHLQSGTTIAEAASEMLLWDADFNTGTHLQALISMGAFSAISD